VAVLDTIESSYVARVIRLRKSVRQMQAHVTGSLGWYTGNLNIKGWRNGGGIGRGGGTKAS